jgi:hypothetical protein
MIGIRVAYVGRIASYVRRNEKPAKCPRQALHFLFRRFYLDA